MRLVKKLFSGHHAGPMLGVGAGIGLTAIVIFNSATAAPACPASRCQSNTSTLAPAAEPLAPTDPEVGDLESVTPPADEAPTQPPAVSTPRRPSTTKAKPKAAPRTVSTTTPTTTPHNDGGGGQTPQPTTTTTAPNLLPVTITVPEL